MKRRTVKKHKRIGLGKKQRRWRRTLPVLGRFLVLIVCGTLMCLMLPVLASGAKGAVPPPPTPMSPSGYDEVPVGTSPEQHLTSSEEAQGNTSQQKASSFASGKFSSISGVPGLEGNARHLSNFIAGSLADFDGLGLDLRHATVKISGAVERTGLCKLEEKNSPQIAQVALASVLDRTTFGILALFFLVMAALVGKDKRSLTERFRWINPLVGLQPALQSAGGSNSGMWVSGYVRSDGTYVRGHFRKSS